MVLLAVENESECLVPFFVPHLLPEILTDPFNHLTISLVFDSSGLLNV